MDQNVLLAESDRPLLGTQRADFPDANSESDAAPLTTGRTVLGLVVGFGLLALLSIAHPLPGLEPRAQAVLGVFLWFLSVTLTGALNQLSVGLITPLLLVLVAGYKVPEGFKAFSSPVFLLAVGAFVIAAVMMGTLLGRRIAIGVTSLVRSSKATRVMGGLAVADVAVGGVLPTASEAALFLPIVKSLNGLMDGQEHKPETHRIRRALLFMDPGLVPLFTGTLILTSHFPNIQLVAQLKSAAGISVSWLDYAWLNLPLWGLLPILFFYVSWWFSLRGVEIPGAAEKLPEMKRELGLMTWPEKYGAACVLAGLALWMTEGLHGIQTEMVAMIVVGFLFLPWGGLKFEQLNPHIQWDTLFLLGGAISLGDALSSSGLAAALAKGVVGPVTALALGPIATVALLAAAFHVARAGIVSSVAMGAAFIPLIVGLGAQLNYGVLPFSLLLVNCLNYAFLLPLSVTSFLLVWGASRAPAWEAVKFGVPLTLICNAYVILVQGAWLSLIGHPLVP
jgi:sodium-dependent dicarboxylate transporter 2/3/5